MGVIKIEGKSVTLPDEVIEAGIPAIKAALSVDFPAIENVEIEIIGSKAPGVVRSATVVKRGTGKGGHHLHSSRGITSGGKSVKQHIEDNAQQVVGELFRHLEAKPAFGSTFVELAQTKCTCGSSDPHPDLHWLIVVGGPFNSAAAAMEALANIAGQKEDVLKRNASLHRPTGAAITGAVPAGSTCPGCAAAESGDTGLNYLHDARCEAGKV